MPQMCSTWAGEAHAAAAGRRRSFRRRLRGEQVREAQDRAAAVPPEHRQPDARCEHRSMRRLSGWHAGSI